jgi:hypothetical protein
MTGVNGERRAVRETGADDVCTNQESCKFVHNLFGSIIAGTNPARVKRGMNVSTRVQFSFDGNHSNLQAAGICRKLNCSG